MHNYFELFDIPVSFVVDLDDLGIRYRQLQQRVHPDKFVTSSAKERRLSMQHATRVNDAYQALKSSLTRAQYLLELNEFSVNVSGVLDNAFLLEQMELRETLGGIANLENSSAALGAFIEKIDCLEKNIIETLTGQFDNITKNITKDVLVQINETIKKLQFITKLKEETVELEYELQ